jgi:hypothetical protein
MKLKKFDEFINEETVGDKYTREKEEGLLIVKQFLSELSFGF